MRANKRLHRTDPARIGPVRNFAGLYHAPEGHTSYPAPERSSSARAKPPKEQSSAKEAVGLAYSVIEKYIRDGKKNAAMLNGQPYLGTKAVTDGFQELLDRTIRYQNELIPLWLEALTSAVRADSSTAPIRPGWPHEDNGTSGRGSNNMLIEMASSRPIEVHVDLHEHSEALPLVILGLRAVDGNKPVLTEISLAPELPGRRIKLRIAISDTVPAGTYSGVIVNRETGEPRGTLSVRIVG